MSTPQLIITVDRGCLKAFAVEKAPGRGLWPPREAFPAGQAPSRPRLRLVEEHVIESAHQRYNEKFSDNAGAFPSGSAPGEGNANGERTGIALEQEARIYRELAAHINDLIHEHQPERWGFAAPAASNAAILDKVDPAVRKLLSANVERDLVRMEPRKMLEYFN